MFRKSFLFFLTIAVILIAVSVPMENAFARTSCSRGSVETVSPSFGTVITPTPAATPAPESAITPETTEAMPESGEYFSEDDFETVAPVDYSDVTIDDTTVLKDLKTGHRGEAVNMLQKRLIYKGYLSETPDGVFGSYTADAVSLFQYQNGLPVTGIADVAMQEMLYSEDCPDSVTYPAFNFEAASNNAEEIKGTNLRTDGRVLQVIVGSEVALRIATRGAYEDVIYVTCECTEENSSLKKSDRIAVYGIANGTYTYKNASGKTVTLPYVQADLVTFH